MKVLQGFDDCFDLLMGVEKGYSNNPADPGGETMWGITKKVAVANGYVGVMKDLPQETAKGIAKKVYWDAFKCDQLPVSLAYEVFDTAYNGGHPIQWLQYSVGVPSDGVMGPATLAAIRGENADHIIMRFNAYRLQYLVSLGGFGTFGKGWVNRIAQHLLQGAV